MEAASERKAAVDTNLFPFLFLGSCLFGWFLFVGGFVCFFVAVVGFVCAFFVVVLFCFIF